MIHERDVFMGKCLLLGMAKGSLDLRGAKPIKLELDYLRLAYAAKERKKKGLRTKCYLFVTSEEASTRIKDWGLKYNSKGLVKVIVRKGITDQEFNLLIREKNRNAIGIDGREASYSIASMSEKVCERCLKDYIEKENQGAVGIKSSSFPFGVQWDYCGEINISA